VPVSVTFRVNRERRNRGAGTASETLAADAARRLLLGCHPFVHLADAGAIGADRLLARIGGLHHDVGTIADQIEATARAIRPADDATCDSLAHTTVQRIVGKQQLVDSGLTTALLERAERSFSRALQAMYHSRLTYPSSDAGPTRPRLLGRSRQGAAS
jgi:hypothetical protein